eukprot:1150293-Pelagomonas_calceolata.AAC.10
MDRQCRSEGASALHWLSYPKQPLRQPFRPQTTSQVLLETRASGIFRGAEQLSLSIPHIIPCHRYGVTNKVPLPCDVQLP